MDYRKEDLDNGWRLVMADGDHIEFVDVGDGIKALYKGRAFNLAGGQTIRFRKGDQEYTDDIVYIMYDAPMVEEMDELGESTFVHCMYGLIGFEEGSSYESYGIYEYIKAWTEKHFPAEK